MRLGCYRGATAQPVGFEPVQKLRPEIEERPCGNWVAGHLRSPLLELILAHLQKRPGLFSIYGLPPLIRDDDVRSIPAFLEVSGAVPDHLVPDVRFVSVGYDALRAWQAAGGKGSMLRHFLGKRCRLEIVAVNQKVDAINLTKDIPDALEGICFVNDKEVAVTARPVKDDGEAYVQITIKWEKARGETNCEKLERHW